jgi:hypothetical protein
LAPLQVQEASGCADAQPGQHPSQQQCERDAPIQRYFQEQLLPTLLATDSRDKLVALTRQLCGLKVVEAQLLASLAAASRRADASLLQSFSLQQALQSCQAKLAALQAGSGPDAPEAALSLQVGRAGRVGLCAAGGTGALAGQRSAGGVPDDRGCCCML